MSPSRRLLTASLIHHGHQDHDNKLISKYDRTYKLYESLIRLFYRFLTFLLFPARYNCFTSIRGSQAINTAQRVLPQMHAFVYAF